MYRGRRNGEMLWYLNKIRFQDVSPKFRGMRAQVTVSSLPMGSRSTCPEQHQGYRDAFDKLDYASMCTAFSWTALHWAAKDGHFDVVRLLLEYGADVNAVSDTGRKPLGMAKGEEVREMLLARGATE